MKTYIPDYNNHCAKIINDNTIRVYDTRPVNSSYPNYNYFTYKDYYINNDYIFSTGTLTVNWNTDVNSLCMSNTFFTSDPIYRVDYVDTLISFSILTSIIVIFPTLLFMKLFKKRGV